MWSLIEGHDQLSGGKERTWSYSLLSLIYCGALPGCSTDRMRTKQVGFWGQREEQGSWQGGGSRRANNREMAQPTPLALQNSLQTFAQGKSLASQHKEPIKSHQLLHHCRMTLTGHTPSWNHYWSSDKVTGKRGRKKNNYSSWNMPATVPISTAGSKAKVILAAFLYFPFSVLLNLCQLLSGHGSLPSGVNLNLYSCKLLVLGCLIFGFHSFLLTRTIAPEVPLIPDSSCPPCSHSVAP